MGYKMFMASQMLRMGGKKAADTASKAAKSAKENLGNMVQEKLRQKKDTERLVEECQQLIQQAAQEEYACRRILEHEYSHWERLVQSLGQQLFQAYQGICEYADAEYVSRQGAVEQLSLPSHQVNLLSEDDCVVLKAVGAGLSVGGGAVGAVYALGTAGTGAAISSLHGGAMMSALLANLGGGTIAAGGLGMAGGMAVLTGLVAVPAALVLGYGINKKLAKGYQEAVDNYQRAQEYAAQVESNKDLADKIIQALRQLTMSISSFSQFFHDMLNMGAVAAGMGKSQEFQPLLNDAAAVLWSYMSLSPVEEDQYNEAFWQELSELDQMAAKCRHGFYEYFMHLSAQEQSSMEGARQDDLLLRWQQAETELSACFGTGWKHLEECSRRSLITGKAFYMQLAATRQHLDYSGVCLMVSRALETELKRRLFQGFCQYVESRYPFATHAAQWPAMLCQWQDGAMAIISDTKITLGSIPYLCHVKQRQGIGPGQMALDNKWLSAYGKEMLFRQALSDEDIRSLFAFIGRFAQYVADKWRNPAAHEGNVGYAMARDCLAYILEANQGLPWLMGQFRS